LNFSQDCPALFITKLLEQPCLRIARVLALIAATYPAAEGHDIGWDTSRAILARNRYPVIGVGLMKEAIERAFAHGAAMAEVVKRKLPIGFRKVVRQIPFKRIAILGESSIPSKIVQAIDSPPDFRCGLLFLLARTFAVLVFVAKVVTLDYCFAALRKGFPVLALSLKGLLSPVAFVAFADSGIVAGFAMPIKSIGGAFVSVKVFASARQFPTAATAVFQRGIHGVLSPYWPYVSRCGKAVRLAFRTVHEAVLSHLPIISRARGIYA